MSDMIMETAVQLAATLLITLIGVLGTYLSMKLGKREELRSINAAQQEVIDLAKQTVGELQQTAVEGLKAAHSDGKLSAEEVSALKKLLVEKTVSKMSEVTYGLLVAAGVDIGALIQGAGESLIARIKERSV